MFIVYSTLKVESGGILDNWMAVVSKSMPMKLPKLQYIWL